MAETKAADHKLVLVNQEKMDVTGISRVESFNPEEILLETARGLLSIKGEDLDMRNLNLEQGVVEIVGLVTDIIYTGEKAGSSGRKGLFEKIFR
ncbi:MAG: sporulation protein YabP [Bacillota bacterium]|jgi:sporulation protein YabP